MKETPDHPRDPLLEFPGYLLRRASMGALAELNERLAQFELRHTSFSLLQLIAANPGIKQTDAGRALEIQRANMVPLVSALEQRGFLSRKPIDGRSQGIELTAAGKKLAKKALAAVQAYERDLMEQVPKNLRSAVVPVLTHLWKGERNRMGESKDGKRVKAVGG